MRYLYALIGVLALILAASAALYSVELREDTYLDKDNASAKFSEEKTLWVTSIDGAPVREVYLGFKNNFKTDAQLVSKSQIASAQLKLYPAEVGKAGNIVAYFVKDETLPTWTWEYRDKIKYNASANATVYADKGECIMDVTPIIREAVAA